MKSATHAPTEPDPQMVELVQRVLDGEASLHDVELLNDSLPQNPDLLSYYVEMRLLHGALENEFEAGFSVVDREDAERPIPFPVAASSARPKAPARFAGKKLAMVAALLLLAALSAFWGVSKLLYRPAFEVVASQGIHASNAPAHGEWVKTLQTLELEQGAIELHSADGNRFVFEGPGSLTIHDTGELTLDSGKLWASLEGESVLIHTPRGEVRDVGTTFGIDASTPQVLRVDVFEGRVRLSNPDDKSQAIEAGMGESLLSQGSSWQPQRGVADASRYQSSIQSQPQAGSIAVLDSGWHATREGSVITNEDLGNLDFTGASKLVVTVAIEIKDGVPGQPSAWEVTYNGEAMAFAGEGPTSPDGAPVWNAIYYLDDPASVGAGDLVVHHPVHDFHASALVLSGTAEGVGQAIGRTDNRFEMKVSSGAMVVAASAMTVSSGRFISDEPFSYIYKTNGFAGGQGKRVLISAAARHFVSGDEIVSPIFRVEGKGIGHKSVVTVEFLPVSRRGK